MRGDNVEAAWMPAYQKQRQLGRASAVGAAGSWNAWCRLTGWGAGLLPDCPRLLTWSGGALHTSW